MTESDQQAILDQIVVGIAELLDAGPEATDVDGLESLACTLALPLDQPGLPTEAIEAAVAAVEARADRRAAGVLVALSRLGGKVLTAPAAAAARRLADRGVVASAAKQLGTLTVEEAVTGGDGSAEMIVAVLRRPGARKRQVAVFGIEHEDTGGALVESVLSGAIPAREARAMMTPEDAPADILRVLSAVEVTRRVAAAAQRSIDEGVSLRILSGNDWPRLSRALTGDPHGLPRPEIPPPWDDDDPELIVDAAEDEPEFHAVMEQLLDELEAYARANWQPGSAVWRHGDFIASTMLQFKGGYGNGLLGRWTPDDLEEYGLDYFARKVTVGEDTLDDLSECMIAFLQFLDARDSLSGAPLVVLEDHCRELAPRIATAACDSTSWGPAKSIAMQMLAEGVDLDAPGAMDDWIAGFNARPLAERDAVIGGSGPQQRRGNRDQRRDQRRSQRSARRNNRPR